MRSTGATQRRPPGTHPQGRRLEVPEMGGDGDDPLSRIRSRVPPRHAIRGSSPRLRSRGAAGGRPRGSSGRGPRTPPAPGAGGRRRERRPVASATRVRLAATSRRLGRIGTTPRPAGRRGRRPPARGDCRPPHRPARAGRGGARRWPLDGRPHRGAGRPVLARARPLEGGLRCRAVGIGLWPYGTEHVPLARIGGNDLAQGVGEARVAR